MIQRPRAIYVSHERPEGPTFGGVSGRTGGEMFNADKAYGGGAAGAPDNTANVYTWKDLLQINPVPEQPKLIYYSGAQPFSRWGAVRRYSRTFMSASPRFFGRWFYVGVQQRNYTERSRMTGVATRQGTTYNYPRFKVSPRSVALGGK
jgi:hypothetical protein